MPSAMLLLCPMKLQSILALVLSSSLVAQAQQEALTLDDLLEGGQQWLQENLDEGWLRTFQQADQSAVQQFLRALQERFQGEYVIDLAALRQTAQVVLPLLESHEETRSYATWLRTRMDYFEAAEELRLIVAPPKVQPGQPPPPRPKPTPEQQRQVWQKRVEKRPPPRGAENLVSRLKPIFVAERVPAELVWLAEIESSFDPNARSPVGAAGLYQFMPATAKQVGLALRPEDERLHPDKSARAAAKYLKYLYGRFNDWRLALAAYNVGEGRVQTLLQKTKARTFDQIAGRLPAETQMYVPKFEATLRRREGINLAQLNPPRR
ncbi:MAG: lytic transglycosylase domain-containing protein [Verrucomicrobia bacterium]|nr:lytic transglycosylase domain-containing protein [Verrucomicrobiota bacterium]